MITGIYFLLLLVMSAEDFRTRTVHWYWIPAVYVLGILKSFISKENRWVTLALTCVCFILLYLFYCGVKLWTQKNGRTLTFGGADVRLVPGMMLVQGWDTALTGVFLGLSAALLAGQGKKQKNREIPLIPWMSAGCFLVEIVYLFSGKSVL